MNIGGPGAYAKAHELIERYEVAQRNVEHAAAGLNGAETARNNARGAIYRALVPAGARDGETFNLWTPKGLIEITARPAKGDCDIRWRVVDESRQKTEATT